MIEIMMQEQELCCKTNDGGGNRRAPPIHQRARHVTPLIAMAGQFPTLAITKQTIDVEGIIVSLVFVTF